MTYTSDHSMESANSKIPTKSSVPNQRLLIIVLAAAVVCVACVFAAVWLARTIIGEPPGQGARAEQGYQVCEPVIIALNKYHETHGDYPIALETLIPDYLGQVPKEVNGYPIEYTKTESGYSLQFSYEGPGMNYCTYTPEKQWDCHGYY